MMTALDIKKYLNEVQSNIKLAEPYFDKETPTDVDPLVYEIAKAYKNMPIEEFVK